MSPFANATASAPISPRQASEREESLNCPTSEYQGAPIPPPCYHQSHTGFSVETIGNVIHKSDTTDSTFTSTSELTKTPVTSSTPVVTESTRTSISELAAPVTSVEPTQPTLSGLVGDYNVYIPVGILRKYTPCTGNVENAEKDDYPASEVSNLEKHHWIYTSVHAYQDRPNWSFVRVYILPDDVGRTTIPRSSTALRRALKLVMAKVDRSDAGWSGVTPFPDQALNSEPEEDESLWYIFNTLNNPNPRVDTINNPYGRKAINDVLFSETDDSGVPGLKTPLYPYQRRSAATMIQREVQPAPMLDPRLQKRVSPTGKVYYYDKEEGSIFQEEKTYSEARGGILAETMGCGKTLICLAVILATRGHFPETPLEYQPMRNPVREKTASLVTMAAAAAGRLSLPWKTHFETLKLSGISYDRCIEACEEARGFYIIPPPPARHSGRSGVAYPRPPPQHLLLGHGTLIVVPPNLMNHWEHEIHTHTEGLKVLIMRNSSDQMPPPKRLLEYDVILFSRTRFEKEAGEEVVYRRHSIRPIKSDLTRIHWLRIIVDEGHNVAGHGHKTNMVHLLNQLHIERRWIVSGTPSSGLYGVEVSLASQESHISDTELSEATAAVLSGRQKTGNAIDSELKDLDKMRNIVVEFLDLKPWSNSSANDPANWTKYIKPIGEDGKRRKSPSLRATLQSLVVRHRMETIHNEIPLPRLYNKVVHLEPTFYDRLNLNLFIFNLAVNAITSERKDQDYMFHARNRRLLSLLISNLRQAGFWWVGAEKPGSEKGGSSEGDLSGTIDIATKYLENNREKMTEDDIAMLTEGIRVARVAVDCGNWNAFKNFQELGVSIENFPLHSRSLWALDPSSLSDAPEHLMGISQAHQAQKFVTSHLDSPDPAEGLAGAGIKVRRELSERGNASDPSKKSTPDKPPTTTKVRKKTTKTFKKGLVKALPLDSLLAKTRVVATTSAKLTYLLDQVLELQKEEKIIIFYDNNNSAFWIAEGLDLLGVNFRIYASTGLRPEQRTAYLTLFRESEELRVLLMDLRQASHGLHIANASRVFIVNPIWQPNVESQAIKRAHRIGQTRPVYVETLVLRDTLEDKILKRRKAMSDSEIQHAEKDLLDDQTMNDIIQNERFYPMAESEASASTKLAYLRNPTGLFDRHKLALPDDYYDETPKRKRAVVHSDADTTTSEEPDANLKRLKPSTHVGFASPSAPVTLTATSTSDPVHGPQNLQNGGEKPKKIVSIFG